MTEVAAIIASIGWPQAALLFALVFIALFFRPLRSFIDRVKSFGKDGVTTDDIPKSQIAESKTKAVEDLMRLGDSTLLKDVETAILTNLQHRGLGATGDSVRVLTHHLAATQIALEFEQVHSVIFGSQIFLLKKLNEFSSVGLDPSYLEKHFDGVQKMFSDGLGDWTLEQYLSFLYNRTLIRMDFGKYHLTVRGAEFLLWLVRMGRSENLPL